MTPDQEALIEGGLALVRSVAGRLKCCVPKAVEFEELIAVGNLGLVKAALKFEPSRGVPFAAYARLRIWGEIRDQFRRDSCISRKARARGEPDPILWSFENRLKPDGASIENILEDHHLGPAQVVGADDTVDAVLRIFKGRDRRIFEMLHVDGHDMKLTAAIIGVSGSRICQINKGLRAKVQEYLETQGAA